MACWLVARKGCRAKNHHGYLLRLASIYIEHLIWQECIHRYDRPHTLFYMDPP